MQMKIPAHLLKTHLPVHTWTGILCGLLLFICFIAGAASVFREALNDWASPPAAWSDNEDLPEILRDTLSRHPQAGEALHLRFDGRRAHLYFETDGQTWQAAKSDGSTVITPWKYNPLGIMADRLHQTAGIPGRIGHHDAGLYVMGIIAALYTLALVSGTVLYLPTLAANLFALRTDKRPRRLWLDIHNLLGISALPFHLVIAFTTVVFAWHDAFYSGLDALLGKTQDTAHHHEEHHDIAPFSIEGLRFPAELIAAVREKAPEAQPVRMTYEHLDNRDEAHADTAYWQHGRRYYTSFNPYDGRIRYSDFALTDPHDNVTDAFFRLHFATFGGQSVRILYVVLGLAGALLFYTGNLLWLDKRPLRGNTPRSDSRIMAALTVGTALGCLNGIALAMLAARWLHTLPVSAENLNLAAYYTGFAASLAYACYRGAPRAAPRLTRTAAHLYLLVAFTALLGGMGIFHLFAHGGALLFFDLAALAAGLILHAAARYTQRRIAQADAKSVWHEKA